MSGGRPPINTLREYVSSEGLGINLFNKQESKFVVVTADGGFLVTTREYYYNYLINISSLLCVDDMGRVDCRHVKSNESDL